MLILNDGFELYVLLNLNNSEKETIVLNYFDAIDLGKTAD